jgi:hypothetical protein
LCFSVLAGCRPQKEAAPLGPDPLTPENFDLERATEIIVCSTNTVRERPDMEEKFFRTEEEWKEILTPDQYRVARQKGTEPAFTGEYWNTHEIGRLSMRWLRTPPLRLRPQIRLGNGMAQL